MVVKNRGQNSNRNTVKQTAENGQKNLGWRRRRRYYVTGAGRQKFKAPTGPEFDQAFWVYYGRSPTNWFWLIMNISNRSRDLAWLRGGTTDVTNARTCLFFFFFLLSVWPSSHWNFDLGPCKKSIRSEIMTWECSFPLTFACSRQYRPFCLLHLQGCLVARTTSVHSIPGVVGKVVV